MGAPSHPDYRVRGSQISLSPSPATLTAKTVTAIATPGQNDIHGAWVRYCWAAFNIDPHDGVGGCVPSPRKLRVRSEEHTSELQSLTNLVCRLLLEKKK